MFDQKVRDKEIKINEKENFRKEIIKKRVEELKLKRDKEEKVL